MLVVLGDTSKPLCLLDAKSPSHYQEGRDTGPELQFPCLVHSKAKFSPFYQGKTKPCLRIKYQTASAGELWVVWLGQEHQQRAGSCFQHLLPAQLPSPISLTGKELGREGGICAPLLQSPTCTVTPHNLHLEWFVSQLLQAGGASELFLSHSARSSVQVPPSSLLSAREELGVVGEAKQGKRNLYTPPTIPL